MRGARVADQLVIDVGRRKRLVEVIDDVRRNALVGLTEQAENRASELRSILGG